MKNNQKLKRKLFVNRSVKLLQIINLQSMRRIELKLRYDFNDE